MAIYLYCFRKSPLRRPAEEAGKNSTAVKAVKTIDKGKAYTIAYKEIEAVVSPVSLKEFGSSEIQKKAQEDVNWIKEKAQIHEHVIEQAMGLPIVPVIPMKFGTIFKTKKNLEEMISKHYAKFKTSLENLAGKQEWGVKIYLNDEVFTKHLQGGWMDPLEVKKKKLPKGMDFFVKKQMEEVFEKRKNREVEGVLKEIFENLQKLAVEANQGKNLDKALTGKEEPMVLNLNLLIKEEKVEEFQKEVNSFKTRYQNPAQRGQIQGLIIRESGPWPPYNFVEL